MPENHLRQEPDEVYEEGKKAQPLPHRSMLTLAAA
jgi:hypothetical protein